MLNTTKLIQFFHHWVERCIIHPPVKSADADAARLYFSISLLAITGSLVLVVFSVVAYMGENLALASFLLIIGLINGSNYLFLRTTHKIQLATQIAALLMVLCFSYLLLTGGIENTGLYWCFVFSPLLFFFLGHRNGLKVCLLLTLSSYVVLLTPDFPYLQADYPEAVRRRFPTIFGVIGILLFIQELSRYRVDQHNRMLTKKLHTVARTDELSGLMNRRGAEEVIKREERRGLRNHQYCSLILADIDLFKNINDNYGHDAGDKTIQMVSAALLTAVRDNDYVARWGGEEFLVILIDAEPNSGVEIAERIRRAVEKLEIPNNANTIKTSVSLGVAKFSDNDDMESVLKRTDVALYEAKQAGRNCVISAEN